MATLRSQIEMQRQRALRARGLCVRCQKPRKAYAYYCNRCGKIVRLYQRNRNNSKPYLPHCKSGGRPPLVKGEPR